MKTKFSNCVVFPTRSWQLNKNRKTRSKSIKTWFSKCVVFLRRQWHVYETKAHQRRPSFKIVWFSLKDKHNSIITVNPQANQRRLGFKIVWFSLGENDILIKTYHATRGTCIATLQENPAARMQNMHQSEDLRAPLSSRLFKRIRQRECRKCLRTVVVQEACHRHFSRESGSENKNCKIWKNDMSTFDENP